MSDSGWSTYFENTKNRKPRDLLVETLQYVRKKDEALDLGSGALNDVRYLVAEGFTHITAVDFEPVAKDIIQYFPTGVVEYVITTFENFDFIEGKYDLINAQYSLPFSPHATFKSLFNRIVFSLKPGGMLTGQFFGERDEWNVGRANENFHTKEEALELLSSLKIITFGEEEVDRSTAAGKMKHWHVFHFIAMK